MLICNESSLWNICHGVACSSNSSQLFSKSKLSIMRTKCTIMLFCLLKDQHIFFLSLRRYVFWGNFKQEWSKKQGRTHSKNWFKERLIFNLYNGPWDFKASDLLFHKYIQAWLPFISSTFHHMVSSENVKTQQIFET